jgi:hypothetical protein
MKRNLVEAWVVLTEVETAQYWKGHGSNGFHLVPQGVQETICQRSIWNRVIQVSRESWRNKGMCRTMSRNKGK